MASNPLQTLEDCGQSVWLDSISREILQTGTLKQLIEADGISGVTANPTIFEKAIVGTHDYDKTITQLAARATRCSPMQIYESLAIQDVGAAADLLRPVYDRTNHHDGFVSIEVSPALASDTKGTVSEACRFWTALHRPNIMIKVPATAEGIPAIEQLIAEGINVNITLIFAVEVYEQVMEAYLKGLERRVQEGKAIAQIASVASFFVSRVDTLVDKLIEEKVKGANDQLAGKLRSLEGKAAIANAKIAYQRFEQVFGSERFGRLKAKGGQVQRPLWASTSTKNPHYPDTLYVDALVGKETVDTMPLQTIQAVRDHGHITCGAILDGVDDAHAIMSELAAAGINMKGVTDQLTAEGVAAFSTSLDTLLQAIQDRQGALVG